MTVHSVYFGSLKKIWFRWLVWRVLFLLLRRWSSTRWGCWQRRLIRGLWGKRCHRYTLFCLSWIFCSILLYIILVSRFFLLFRIFSIFRERWTSSRKINWRARCSYLLTIFELLSFWVPPSLNFRFTVSANMNLVLLLSFHCASCWNLGRLSRTNVPRDSEKMTLGPLFHRIFKRAGYFPNSLWIWLRRKVHDGGNVVDRLLEA